MRVAWTLCAPSASPALTKVAHRCLLAPTTTHDERMHAAAKLGALFGDGCAREEKFQHSSWMGVGASHERCAHRELCLPVCETSGTSGNGKLSYAGPVVTSVADISMFASDTKVDPFEDNNYVTCVNYDAESLEILGKGCSAVKAELDANPAAYAGLVESDNDLALVEYATRYDRDFALTCADAATKSATASITKVACPATLGVVAVTPANGHDRYYSGGVYYPAKPDLTSADACAVPGLPTTTAAPGAFTPKVAGAGMLKFYLKGASVYDAAVTVASGAISAMSTVEGSGLTMMAEAGVTATLDVVP
ncbi:hypothetical protein RI054_10g51730 [Pseudoscourfieldia marina]